MLSLPLCACLFSSPSILASKFDVAVFSVRAFEQEALICIASRFLISFSDLTGGLEINWLHLSEVCQCAVSQLWSAVSLVEVNRN